MKLFCLTFAILLTGCAANSGVVAIGSDTFMLSRQAATGFSGASTLKAEAIQEAAQFCTAKNKTFQLKNSTEAKPPFVFGNYPKAEIEFTCT